MCLLQHPTAESLCVGTVDVGEAEPRTVVSGIAASPSVNIDELSDRLAILLCNIKPSAVKGVQSQALLLTAVSRYCSAFILFGVLISFMCKFSYSVVTAGRVIRRSNFHCNKKLEAK